MSVIHEAGKVLQTWTTDNVPDGVSTTHDFGRGPVKAIPVDDTGITGGVISLKSRLTAASGMDSSAAVSDIVAMSMVRTSIYGTGSTRAKSDIVAIELSREDS